MIQRWLALTYYLYALRLAALSHFYLIDYINRYVNCGLSAQPCLFSKNDCQAACFSVQAS